jgi:hypothetical protein
MVSKTFQRNKIFSWSMIFNQNGQGGYEVYYYDPDGVTMYKIALDAASVTQLNGIIAQIQAWMNQQDTWSGTIQETWKLQDVTTQASTTKQWVKQ